MIILKRLEVNLVKYYFELAKLGVFSIADVEALTGNKNTAYSTVRRLMNKKLVQKIKNNLYTCLNIETKQPIASKYQIASAINETAYVSHHTAFEYYGNANQVYYDVYVSSNTRFNNFEFDGLTYKYVPSKLMEGVTEPRNTKGVRITDIERTITDSIKDFEKIGGLEELLACLNTLTFINEKKLLLYLNSYDIQALYQKTGYILKHYKNELKLSGNFFNECRNKVGKSIRYLSRDMGKENYFDSEWKLVVPRDLFYMSSQGGSELV